jgi:hypothetical protein
MSKRVDANQSDIVARLREVGASVTPTHEIGRGFPDLAIGFRGVTYLAEVKDGSKPKSRRRLTPDEAEWHSTWRGQVAIVETVDDALKLIGVI